MGFGTESVQSLLAVILRNGRLRTEDVRNRLLNYRRARYRSRPPTGLVPGLTYSNCSNDLQYGEQLTLATAFIVGQRAWAGPTYFVKS